VGFRFDHWHQYLQVAMGEDNQTINNASILFDKLREFAAEIIETPCFAGLFIPTFTQQILTLVRLCQLYMPILPAKTQVFAGNSW